MRKMKNTLILAVMIFCLWITTGLSLAAEEEQPAQGNPANRLEEILQRGKLIVATSPDFAPQEFIDGSKKGQEQYVGSDILMAQYIADQLGVELEIQAMDFAMVLSSVDLGESDMAISGFGWKEDREDSFELSDGFNKTGEAACQGLMIRRADAEKYPDLASFDGKLIAAQAGSLQENYVQTQLPQATLETITSMDIGILSLTTNKVDALASDCDVAKGYVSKDNSLILADARFDTTLEDQHAGNVLAVKKGETELIAAINNIIADINEKGLYEQWKNEAKTRASELGIEFDGSEGVAKKSPGVIQVFQENSGIFMSGLWETLKLAAITVFFGTIFGALIAIIKLSKNPLLKFITVVYVEVLRGTPILVQLYIFRFFLPMAFPWLNLSKYACVVIALVFNSSAYVAEIIRSGIQAVDKGQSEAAKSLGMSNRHMMMKIMLPQAVKNILPALGNEFVTMIKETSLASTFYIGELMYTRTLLMSTKFYAWQPLIIIAAIYFVVTFVLSKGIQYMEKRMSVSD